MVNLKNFGITRKAGQLSNGTHLAVFRKQSSPIYTRLAFLSGSRFDPIGKEGLAHFMEHMLLAGTKKYPSKDKLAEYIENCGGMFGATTGNEIMRINIEVADKSDFNIVVNITNQMINESIYSSKAVDAERETIHNEINERKSNPSIYVWEFWRTLFFQQTEMGRSVGGSHETIDKITPNDLKSISSKKLTASNLSIIISGDINFNFAEEMIENKLHLSKSKQQRSSKILPIYRKRSIIISRNQNKQVHYIFGFRTVSKFDKDYEVLSLISAILGRGGASILNKKLRYEKGFVYGVGTNNHGLSDAGSFIVKTSTSKKDLSDTINIIVEEFKKIKTNGFTKVKLDFAKNKIRKSITRNMQTSSSWVNFHTLGELIRPNNYLKLDGYINKIMSIDNSQVIEVANKYFNEGKWYLAVVGNIKESDIHIDF